MAEEISNEAFNALVAHGFETLPDWVRAKIKNVALLVEDEPSYEDRKREGLSDAETLLGLYKGIPLSARGDFYGVGMTMPDTITLYKLPILEAALHDDKPVNEVITETILHEFAHHFGMNEVEVRAWEKRKKSH